MEVAIMLGLVVILAAGGLAAWRLLRGPAGARWQAAGRLALVALVAAGLVGWGSWQFSKQPTRQLFGGLVARATAAEKVVALTFDDGPTASYTDEVLAILDREGVPATFFVVGEALARNPEECRKIVAGGHALGNHSYSHPVLMLKSYGTIRDEIERTDALIRACGYEGEIYFRPPNGKKLLLLPYYLARTGRTTVTWDLAPEWGPEGAAGADEVVRQIVDEVQPGSIVLLHVMYRSRETSRQALPHVIHGLKEKGYRFVTIPKLLE
ncbi:MAG: polysaccharide deacetylase family protein [Anaerolineae bacterium]